MVNTSEESHQYKTKQKITVEYLHGAELNQSIVVVKVANAQDQTLGVVRLPR